MWLWLMCCCGVLVNVVGNEIFGIAFINDNVILKACEFLFFFLVIMDFIIYGEIQKMKCIYELLLGLSLFCLN